MDGQSSFEFDTNTRYVEMSKLSEWQCNGGGGKILKGPPGDGSGGNE